MKNLFLITIFIFSFNIFVFSTEYKIHYLQDGETLWRISKQYNIALNDLCNLNKIDDVTKVKKGAKIKIPFDNSEKKVVTVKNEDSNKKERTYFDYAMPLKGNIIPFVTSHFRGIIIFSDESDCTVSSIDNGYISYIGDVSGYGITVIIKHDNGYISSYSGFKEIFVKKGSKVGKKEVLGSAGNLSRYKKNGILFSVKYKDTGLKFDMERQKFFKE